MKRKPQTRGEKIKFLNDLKKGVTTIQEFNKQKVEIWNCNNGIYTCKDPGKQFTEKEFNQTKNKKKNTLRIIILRAARSALQ